MAPLSNDNNYLFAFYAFAFYFTAKEDKQFWMETKGELTDLNYDDQEDVKKIFEILDREKAEKPYRWN